MNHNTDISRQKIYNSIQKLEKILCLVKEKTLEELNLTTSQAQVIYTLSTQSSVKQIAETLYISSSATTQLIEILEKKGLVTRTHSLSDRRVVNVELTEYGHKIKEKLIKKRLTVTNALLKKLSNEEVSMLSKIYDKMADNIQKEYDD